MRKSKIPTDIFYILGIIILAFGITLILKGGFGMSMVVAPAYMISLKFNSLTFGMAEYTFQAFLLVIVFSVIRFRWVYFLSFLTAFIYGHVLDLWIWIFSNIDPQTLQTKILIYALGILMSSLGIALFFRTNLPMQVYELFVKEISEKFNWNISTVKTIYDCCSCILAVSLSLLFFGRLRDIGIGTIICSLTNGPLIGIWGKLIDKYLVFSSDLGIGKFFTLK